MSPPSAFGRTSAAKGTIPRLHLIGSQAQHFLTDALGKTDASRDLIILTKDRRIKELEAENQNLKLQLKVALANTYDQLS
ncbi:hypothetical protein KSF_043070 [Reticulibacter mediterranei]|uniref:Uncharacterized protein n=1 Tax=Reticulibacter mediterranei TaxID=2778369 RepID=A0A8J3IF87_9CHLR|nr:hypothetical protein KSF_043070 [Reticulibacter mediterranei]